MQIKLFDSELKIMELLWEEGDITAKRLAELAKEQVGWSKTTTYTVIKKCMEKGAIERHEPNFLCHALVTREEAQQYATNELVQKMYHGAADQLVAALLGSESLTAQEITQLKQLVRELE